LNIKQELQSSFISIQMTDKVELAELTELFEAVAAAARKELVESTR
jgi:hypothetical protein